MVDTTARRGLGRGLSALLGDPEPPEPDLPRGSVSGARSIPIEHLRRNPEQPRRHFDEEQLEELAASIKEKGVLQPILVRPAPGVPGEYQIVAGERRWRAAQKAGLHAVPALVRELDDLDVAEIGIIENVQRADLNPLEEAQGYRALIERFGRTQEAIAQTVGKSRSHVANALRLLSLPETVRQHLAAGRMSAGHARAIASTPDPERLARTIVDQELSVRQAEALARGAELPPKATAKPRRPAYEDGKDADTRALEQDLSDALGLAVEITNRGEGGEVRISYSSFEQLDELCRRLSHPAS